MEEGELKRQKTETGSEEEEKKNEEVEEEEEEEEEDGSSENELLLELEELDEQEARVDDSFEEAWDGAHVRMPCSARSLYRRQDGSDATHAKWPLLVQSLVRPIASVAALEKAVNRYQATPCFMPGLRAALRDETVRRDFFLRVLPRIQRLVLRTPRVLHARVALLEDPGRVMMTRLQCACVLANMWLGTWPRQGSKRSQMGSVDFFRLFASTTASNVAKLQCFISYFGSFEESDEVVEFVRVRSEPKDLHFFQSCETLVTTQLEILCEGKIEDSSVNDEGWCEVDFANKQLGGGVLGNGAIQEEIRFAMGPELVASRLLCAALRDDEAVYVRNTRIFNEVEGYSSSFRFVGHQSKRVLASIVAIDALQFAPSSKLLQWDPEAILRELNKCLVGFCSVQEDGLATGNWGAGFFNGDPELKSILQLLCCSIAGKKMRYYTFCQLQRLGDVHEKLIQLGATVGSVVSLILKHDTSKSLFDEILELE